MSTLDTLVLVVPRSALFDLAAAVSVLVNVFVTARRVTSLNKRIDKLDAELADFLALPDPDNGGD